MHNAQFDLAEMQMLLQRLLRSIKELEKFFKNTNWLSQMSIQQEIDRLRKSERYRDPRNLIPFGYKVYSQCDEDGIIREIFQRIGTTNKIFVECGVGNGLENNTLALLFDDWEGIWIDASASSVKTIRHHFANVIHRKQLKVIEAFVTSQNVNELLSLNLTVTNIDLLSIDIDGNDYHILTAITAIQPRVIVIEYNAKFIPPTLFCMRYDEKHAWKKDDNFGVSLEFLQVKLQQLGYSLVACNLAGINAFFVRSDLVGDKFQEPFTARTHYEPARYHLISLSSGHPPSYDTLSNSTTQ